MNKKQQESAMNKLTTGLNVKAAEVFTRQPGLDEQELNKEISKENNNEIINERNNEAHTPVRNDGTEEVNTDATRRGPKKKGEFKKVTLNLDVELNLKLDEYILTLKQQALRDGKESPNKSEWVRDVVEEKLREIGVLQ